jgi:HPt (histidine-containing phosphotransfer) domain-containing protein
MSRILALTVCPGSLAPLIEALREEGHDVVEVVPGSPQRAERVDDEYDLAVVHRNMAFRPEDVTRWLRHARGPVVAIRTGDGEDGSAGPEWAAHAVTLQARAPDELMPRIRELLNGATGGDSGRPVYDRAVALKRLLGNEALLAELAGLFFEDAPLLYEELRMAVESSDAATARRAAHSLAGNAATFEGLDAMEAARAVELAAARGDLAAARDGLSQLASEIARLEHALRREFDETARSVGR